MEAVTEGRNHTLPVAAKQRYLWVMAPEDPGSPDPALSWLYQLAEHIGHAITDLAPDWCQIERDAEALRNAAAVRCQERNDERRHS